jgi:hypothetical protein
MLIMTLPWTKNVSLKPPQTTPRNYNNAYAGYSPSHVRALLVPHGNHPRPSRMLLTNPPWPHPDQVCRQCFQERSKHVLRWIEPLGISREEQWKFRAHHWHYGADQVEPGLKGFTVRGRLIDAMVRVSGCTGIRVGLGVQLS